MTNQEPSVNFDFEKIGFKDLTDIILKKLSVDYYSTALICGSVLALTILFIYNQYPSNDSKDEKEKQESVKTPLRDFTIDQLRDFNGTNNQPIYISLRFEVYDVSSAAEFYGEGSGYHCFAGREASRAMALLSFDEAELSSTKLDDLNSFSMSSLDDWIMKFKHYKSYPIVGKISFPPKGLQLKRSELHELRKYDGTQAIPEGRVDAPIYMAVNGKIFDVSYGGKDFYGGQGGYSIFAGRDASRALAKMSFDEEDRNNTELSDLTAAELKVLSDWETKFEHKRKYPIVGTILD